MKDEGKTRRGTKGNVNEMEVPNPLYDIQDLPDRLRAIRLEKGMSNHEFGGLAGIRERNYEHYENRRATPPLWRLIKLANVHGIDLNELLKA